MKKSLLLLLFLVMSSQYSRGQDNTRLFSEIENYLYSPKHERKQSKDYFNKINALANEGDAEAYYYLGVLQKDGIGTKQNLKKSKKSFIKAFELGNARAAYSIGYYHLKGFGQLKQDYTKAYNWFKKSDDPMAAHWRAKMHFFGLGKKTNKAKALSILNSNDLPNSEYLATQYKNSSSFSEATSNLLATIKGNSSLVELHALKGLNKTPHVNYLEGEWEGEYFELDWSKTKAFRVLPIEVKFSNSNGINSLINTELKIADSIETSQGNYSAGTLGFESLNIPIEKQYTDYPVFTHLMNDIQRVELRQLHTGQGTFLVGKIDAYLHVWQEKANPTLIILKKKKINLSEEALTSFNNQKDSFIRLYPNPFADYMLINFELTHQANVKVVISDYYTSQSYNHVVFNGLKQAGEHTLEVYDLPNQKGTYLVSIEYDGKKETKIIIN